MCFGDSSESKQNSNRVDFLWGGRRQLKQNMARRIFIETPLSRKCGENTVFVVNVKTNGIDAYIEEQMTVNTDSVTLPLIKFEIQAQRSFYRIYRISA